MKLSVLALLMGLALGAQAGLKINAVEIGVSKFHRLDNQLHPYSVDNTWASFRLLPTGADLSTPRTLQQKDGSYSIYFSSLQEVFETITQLSKATGQKISILNFNAHGTPGGMWFPKSTAQKNSLECYTWGQSAAESDQENYDQYYSEVSKGEIMQIRKASMAPMDHYGCVTGLTEFQEQAAQIPNFKSYFAADFQLHLFSCNVGLGSRGEELTRGLAELFLSAKEGRIESSLPLGLGDFSMPEGMGFWDYQDDDQLDRDNENYVKHKTDREQMQKGSIRVAALDSQNHVTSGLIENVEFMFADADSRPFVSASPHLMQFFGQAPATIRIPGTAAKLVRP